MAMRMQKLGLFYTRDDLVAAAMLVASLWGHRSDSAILGTLAYLPPIVGNPLDNLRSSSALLGAQRAQADGGARGDVDKLMEMGEGRRGGGRSRFAREHSCAIMSSESRSMHGHMYCVFR